MSISEGDLLSDTAGEIYTVVALGRRTVIVTRHTDQSERAYTLDHVEKWERLPSTRVGQVRERPSDGERFVVLSEESAGWVCVVNDPTQWPTATPFHAYVSALQKLPVVGWSRGHTPPPVLTGNPAEVVQGDVRSGHGAAFVVTGFRPHDHEIERLFLHGPGVSGTLPMVADWRLVARPGVTL